MTDNEKEAIRVFLENINHIVKMVEANRRLLSGITTLFIDKGLLTIQEVNSLEKEVSAIQAKKKKKRRRKRKRKTSNDS